MHRHKNLFDQVCSLENMHAAAIETLRGKRSKPAGTRFLCRIEDEIVDLCREIDTGVYRHGGYNYFTITDPKERLVAAAGFRDRVVHHAIVRVIEPIFEKRFIEDSFACRRGKGTHAAMRRALHFTRRYPYALKCDVAKYFASVDHATLTGLLERVIGDKRLMDLIRNVLESHTDGVRREWKPGGGLFDITEHTLGLPIGNLTSQFFANVYLNPLDHFIKHVLRVRGYVRYMDDFILFGDSPAQLRDWGRGVKAFLQSLMLHMHPKKYRLMPTARGVDFAGFVLFSDGRVRVRSSTVKRFDRRFKRMLWEMRTKRRQASDITQRVQAWTAHTLHAQSYGLRKSVLMGRA